MITKKCELRGLLMPSQCSRTKRVHQLMKMAVIQLLLLVLAATVRGQSALDGFDPNANGTVRVMVVQPDGKILLAGDFTTLSPNGGGVVARNRIARLNPDGTLDATFDPNAMGLGTVASIALQADGKILVGGQFTNIGGQPRNNIARLDAATGLADSFNPNANDFVGSIVVQADGKILVGGRFDGTNSIGGQTRSHMARLDATSGLADSFNPNANGEIYAIAVLPTGKILAGGFFSNIGAQNRFSIARLDATTGLADAFAPQADREVTAITLQPDGKILVGGHFANIGSQSRHNIARLDATTGLADSFDPNVNGQVYSITLQADGKILVGGFFYGANSIGGQSRNYIARLDATTGIVDSFDPNAGGGAAGNDGVFAIAVQADGKILVGGYFTTLAPSGGAVVTRSHVARLEIDGRLDRTLDIGLVGNEIDAIAVQPDGKILVGGFFSTVTGVTRRMIARLNTDGTLDSVFNASANGNVYAIAVQGDGKILVGGQFNAMGGQGRNSIARLDATGLADSFNPNAFGTVNSIAVQADGKILFGGSFTSVGGQARKNIARVNANGTLDTAFNPNPDNVVNSIAVQADGKILVGGFFAGIGGQSRARIARLDGVTGLADSFDPNADGFILAIVVQADGKILAGGGQLTTIGGQARSNFARLDPTTGLADSFNPGASNTVRSIAVQADGKILASGDFTSIGGQTRNRIARLDVMTGVADSFDPGADDSVYSIGLQTDGKVLAGGQFATAGGQTRNRIVRLTNDTAAMQDLAVTQTTITWTRSGSSPQLTRVTFEYSTDNVNYTVLGNGTALGGNWVLTGLSLPTGLNSYIRGRGYYPSGNGNGSGNITESVRNARLTGPVSTPTPTPTLTPIPTPTPIPGACVWSAASVLPVTINGEAITSLNGNLYSFGGTSGNVRTATSYRFDGTSWTTIAPLPVALAGATAVNDGANIYVLGGFDSNSVLLNTLYKYDPVANAYMTLAPFATPTTGHGAAYLNGKIYKFCGATASFPTGTLEIYDVSSNQWAVGADYPLPVTSIGAFAHGNSVYGAGGFVVPIVPPGFPTAKTYRYNPVTNAWDDAGIADLPATRYQAAAASYNDGGVLAGGFVGGNISASVIFWNPASNTWSNYPDMLAERSNMSGGVLDGSFYLVGGSSIESPSGGTNDNQKLTCLPAPMPTPTATSTPSATATGTPTPTPTPTPSGTPGTFGNISTRLRVETDDNVLIGGFIVTGTQPKKIIVRAIGPSLSSFFPGVLGDPVLELRNASGVLLATNDNWRSDQEAEILATGIPPADDLESAIVATLPANNSAYTAIVRGVNNATGIGVVEAYDLDHTVDSKLGNISTRGLVQTGDNVMIGGLIVLGQNPLRVIVRAIGPSLPVPGALGDPILELHDGNGALIAANDSWRSDQEAEIIATGIPPSSDLEAAIVRSFAPGNYTAIVRGVNNTTGVAVVEAYGLN
jgi:uncharacterized delta-60 repeat protein